MEIKKMQAIKPNCHVFSLLRIVTAMAIMLSTVSTSFAQTLATKPSAEKSAVDAIKRLDYQVTSPEALDAMMALTTSVKNSGLDPNLVTLVSLRASQINGCDFCLDWHTKDAKTAKMDERKLDSLPEWRTAAAYTDREKAALEWTEAVTLVSQTHVPDDVYEIARKQFSEKELVDLTTAIIATNGWNRLNIAFRTPIVCEVSDAPVAAAEPAAMKKPQVSVEILSQNKYEGKLDGKETTVTVVELTLDPLAGGTPHRHPGPVNGYILEGTYEFQVEGGPVQTLTAGDTFFEPAMILHKVSRNPDKVKRARVLATMVHPSDVESLTIRDPGDEPQSSTVRSANLVRAAEPTPLTASLPIVGLLIYDGVLQTEITAPSDVFSKHSEDGKQLFNVITIGPSYDLVTTEEGLHLFPDYTFDDAPKLDVIVVPSSYDMLARVKDERLVRFIQSQDKNTKYTVSNCGGASLIGASGIAQGKEIVTWVGGGKGLQANYPGLKVQDDAKVSFVEDGKLLSSNGNLASYISALELLEKMASKEHRKFVESHLYLERLRNWKDK